MLPISQVAGSVAQRPGGREQALSQPAWLMVVMTLNLILGTSCYPAPSWEPRPVFKAHVISSSKSRSSSVVGWHVKLFKPKPRMLMSLLGTWLWGMQTQQKTSQKLPGWTGIHVPGGNVEDISMQPGNWELESVWSQDPTSSCVKGNRKPGKMKADTDVCRGQTTRLSELSSPSTVGRQ